MKCAAYATVAVLWVVSTVHAQGVSASSTDLWDVSQGATVTGHSALLSGSSAGDIFGASTSSVEGGRTLFSDSSSNVAGTVHYVEWSTITPVTVQSLNLFAAFDRGSSDSSVKWRDLRARGISRFRLLADTGSGFIEVFDYLINVVDGGQTGAQPGGATSPTLPNAEYPADPVYGDDSGPGYVVVAGPGGNLTLTADFGPVTASDFRAEFTQFGVWDDIYLPTRGPRISELDGFDYNQTPEPAAWSIGVLGVGLILRRRR